jgi:hypothetical protein
LITFCGQETSSIDTLDFESGNQGIRGQYEAPLLARTLHSVDNITIGVNDYIREVHTDPFFASEIGDIPTKRKHISALPVHPPDRNESILTPLGWRP